MLCVESTFISYASNDYITSGDYQYEIVSENNKTIELRGYIGEAKDVIVPKIIDGYTVIGVGYDCFRTYSSHNSVLLKSIVLPDSVEYIESFAFADQFGLESVSLPSSLKTIGSYAFQGCKLTNINLPEGILEIGFDAFRGTRIEKLFIPYSVKKLDVLGDIEDIALIEVDDRNPYYDDLNSNVIVEKSSKKLVWMSSKCKSLPQGIEILATWSLMGANFGDDYFKIPDSVKKINSGAFCWCGLYDGIRIPDGVESIDVRAFGESYICDGIYDVYLPSSLTYIDEYAFEDIKECIDDDEDKIIDIEDELVFHVDEGSYAHKWAKRYYPQNEIDTSGSNYTNGIFSHYSDTWNFQNYARKDIESRHYIGMLGFRGARLYYGADNPDRGEGGHCFGMCLTASAIFNSYPSLSSFGDYKSNTFGDYKYLNDVSFYDSIEDSNEDLYMGVYDFINYACVYQMSPVCEKAFKKNEGNLNGLYESVKRFENNNGEPVIISVKTTEDRGHALIGIKILSETNDEVRIQVYDSNYPNKKKVLTLDRKKGKFTGWSFDFQVFKNGKIETWSNKSSESSISYCLVTNEFIRDFKNSLDMNYNNIESYLVGVTRSTGKLWIEIGNVLVDLTKAISSEYLTPIYNWLGSEDDTNNQSSLMDYYWLDASAEEIYFENMDGETKISLTNDDYGVDISCDSEFSVSVNLDEHEVVFDGKDDSVLSIELSQKVNQDEVQTLSLSVNTSESVCLKQDENNIELSGCDILQISQKSFDMNTETETEKNNYDLSSSDDDKYMIELKDDETIDDCSLNGHSWNEGEVTKQPTCTLEGVKEYTCTVCHEKKTENIAAKGHTEVKDPAVEATTEKTGLTEGSHCSVCNAVIKRQEIVPKKEDTKKKAEEEAKKKAEAESKKKVEEAKQKAEAEAKKKAEEEAKRKAEEEAKKKAEEEVNKKAEEPEKTNYSNEWVNGKYYDINGQQTREGTLAWCINGTGKWVEDTNGWYPTNEWMKIDGIWYYFKPDGYAAENEYYFGYWFNFDGTWNDQYFLSWKCNSKGWWVEDISGWWPSSSWLKIDGCWYYFNSKGYMVTNRYIDGYWIGADGVCW